MVRWPTLIYLDRSLLCTGKQWRDVKKPFRPTAGQTSYAKRAARDKEVALVKAHEKELKEEKAAEREVGISESLSERED